MSDKPLSAKSPGLRDFFFAEETPYGMALARIMVPLAVGLPMWLRFSRVRELFTTDGTPVQMFELYGNGERLPVFSPAIAIPLYGIMLLCLLLTSVGFRTRLSLCIAAPLYIYFNMLDGVGTMTKYSVIGCHLLVLLAVSNAGLVWSLDAVLQRKRHPEEVMPARSAIWPARLMQLLFCFIYFGAAVTKIQTTEFFSGEQMRYWMLSNWNYENPVGEMMAMWSWLLPVSAYIAVVWEILFGFLVFQRRTRLLMLGLGISFHFMTWLTLGLYIFPAICLSAYFAFMSESDVVTVRRWIRRLHFGSVVSMPGRVVRKLADIAPPSVPQPVAFAGLIAITAITATEVERQLDIYGTRHSDGGLALVPMERTVVQTMIAADRPIREQDKFFSFDLGTVMVGNQLANRRREFAYGELVVAQCNLNPPHEDLWVECQLQDEEARVIERFGQIVTREQLRSIFTYRLGNKLVPGEYDMVLKSGNHEIHRRRFELTGSPDTTDLLTN